MSVIELRDVEKAFWPGPVRAVDGVGLRVEEGEIVTLVGPSGCGKTTTLRLLAGFEAPDRGTVSVGGRVVAGDDAWVPPEGRGVGMVPQDYALFPHLDVLSNVTFGLHRLPRRERERRAMGVLATLEMEHAADRYPHELSGGQRQRVALARALAPEPVVVLMDEPFSNLDAHLRDTVRDEVVSILRRTGTTCLLVSHDQRDALAVSDRVAVMNRGRVEQVAPPRELYRHPASVFVATFVGRTNLLRGVVRAGDGCVLPELGALCPVDPAGLADGTEVVVAVRPEGFEISDGGALEGRIVSTVYAGTSVEAEVEVEGAGGGRRSLTVHLPTHRVYREGERLRLRLDADYASVVRNACESLRPDR